MFERTYVFKMSDGDLKKLTLTEAKELHLLDIDIQIKHIAERAERTKRSRSSIFTLPDGSNASLSLEEAFYLNHEHLKDQIKKKLEISKTRRRVRDGFSPGWQENINAYAGGRREYEKLLKDKGLIEVGYDYTPKESTLDIHPCANEEFAMAVKQVDSSFSDSEVEAIKTGDYFKDA